MSDYGMTDGTVYLASDGQWYRWPDPTPHASEEDARAYAEAADAPEPEPQPEPQPFAPPSTEPAYGAPAGAFDPQAYGPPATPFAPPVTPGSPWGTAPYAQVPEGPNRAARASMWLGIFAAFPFSIVFGIIGLVQTKKTGQSGRRMAIAGLVLSAIWLGIFGTIGAINAAHRADRAKTGEIVAGGDVSAFDFRPGDCVNGLVDKQEARQLPGVPCAEPHEGEVFATFELPAGAYPGPVKVQADSKDGCLSRFEAYASPEAEGNAAINLFLLSPTEGSWTRDPRVVTCIAYLPGQKSIGSIKG